MKHRFLYFLIIVTFCITGCNSFSSHKKTPVKTENKSKNKTFSLPEIPMILSSEKDRAEYMALHYWEKYDFTDTLYISNSKKIENIYGNFLQILPHIPEQKAKEALTGLMDASSVNNKVFLFFINLTQKYLYDPNSPFRNDELYIPVLRYLIASPKLQDIYKTRYQFQLDNALKNRPGNIASDFSYTLKSGKKHKMHDIRSSYTLLYFNNPGCHECKVVKDYMLKSMIINKLAGKKLNNMAKLTILSVYIDEDLKVWKESVYPDFIINCYDTYHIIQKDNIYDLKAIPAMYLLDKDKKVILKDVSIMEIEDYLAKATK